MHAKNHERSEQCGYEVGLREAEGVRLMEAERKSCDGVKECSKKTNIEGRRCG